ncbi:hypothetical protein L249_8743 [Ophiocordyceps polyrhachis-furcata BCC 54312]|uniref:Uncharacterized protein n=1 Tax=Ophiocordyceps polyrhachis-furcata BCC 54312 TaxID=1330021 RepID=A0A367L6J1_9HYPO|nr:hypothetical protein L249_8743 [Ophiocordyceps polyrhachis-furcata BCC 54312]
MSLCIPNKYPHVATSHPSPRSLVPFPGPGSQQISARARDSSSGRQRAAAMASCHFTHHLPPTNNALAKDSVSRKRDAAVQGSGEGNNKQELFISGINKFIGAKHGFPEETWRPALLIKQNMSSRPARDSGYKEKYLYVSLERCVSPFGLDYGFNPARH